MKTTRLMLTGQASATDHGIKPMKTVRGVKIPTPRRTTREFREKWSRKIAAYSLQECEDLKRNILNLQKRRGQVEVEQRYLLVLLRKRLTKPVRIIQS